VAELVSLEPGAFPSLPVASHTSRDLGATSTAVVTGAGLGLGRGIALRLAQDGLAVAAIDVDLDAAADSVEQIAAAGGDARLYRADVGDAEAVQKACGDILRDFGAVKVVVNCAGWDEVHPFVETD
jgi:NAD(P)-dependent dehydrogenase (short-subunit alcohol dehydrogenase family)